MCARLCGDDDATNNANNDDERHTDTHTHTQKKNFNEMIYIMCVCVCGGERNKHVFSDPDAHKDDDWHSLLERQIPASTTNFNRHNVDAVCNKREREQQQQTERKESGCSFS